MSGQTHVGFLKSAVLLGAAAVTLGLAAVGLTLTRRMRSITEFEVRVSGGHETDPRDHGRPVILVAAALGVPASVFREAFSHVRPAPAGTEPDPEQVRLNKNALLAALSRYGVTNERLDEVSNYYRYRPGEGEIWKHRPARIQVTVVNGKIQKLSVLERGAGYTSPPSLSIPGRPDVKIQAQVSYGKNLESNGAISEVNFAQ